VRGRENSEKYDQHGNQTGLWYEPDIDEIVEKLEWAYQNRDALRPLAQRGGEDLAKMTWASTAQQFFRLLKP